MNYELESTGHNIVVKTDEGVKLEFLEGTSPDVVIIDDEHEIDFYNIIETAMRFKIGGEVMTLEAIRKKVQADAEDIYAEVGLWEMEEAEHDAWYSSPEKSGRI